MVAVILATQVVHVAGPDQAAPDFAGDADDALVALVLIGQAVLLHLEVDVPGAEDSKQLVGVRARVVVAVLHAGAGRSARPGSR